MKKILVIDDDTSTTESIAIYLEEIGYEVFSAHNGLEGLNVIKENEPDLIISDVRMPEINGIELCLILKGLNYSIPVILISAHDLNFGFSENDFSIHAFISKPINIFELINYINEVFLKNRGVGNVCLN